jgi:hypothetical protein
MKKIVFTLVFSLAAVFAVFAQTTDEVTIRNETGYDFKYLYFSPAAYDDWGDDLLAGGFLADGEDFSVKLDRPYDESETIYDLQAVDVDDDYYTIYEVDISKNPMITVTMENYDNSDEGYEDYGGYEEGYNAGYAEGYKQGYIEAFRDAYLEGFRAAGEVDIPTESWR